MTRARVFAKWFGAFLVIAGVAPGVVFGIEHRQARDAWLAESERLEAGDPTYNAALSDELYASVLPWRHGAEWAGRLSVLGFLLILLSRPVLRAAGEPVRARSAHAAVLVDGAIVFAGLWAAFGIESWLGPNSAAWGAFLSNAMLGLFLAYAWGGLCMGDTLGGRLTRTRVTDADGQSPGVMRGLMAALLLPVAVLWAPIALLLAPQSQPPHLLWTRLRTVATHGGQI